MNNYLNAKQAASPNQKVPGLQHFIAEAQERCWKETNTQIKLSQSALSKRLNGQTSIRDFSAGKRWLSNAEEDIVVDYAIELAERGHPLSHKRLKEHVDEILKGKSELEDIPDGGVGENWTSRFAQRHSNRLGSYWSHPLDHSRARAVNPVTKQAFFKLYDNVRLGKVDGSNEEILISNIYGKDESGVQDGVGMNERVFEAKGKGIQHQQRSGGHENITVTCTICADGTSDVPLAVIFKGNGYQCSWKQNNPLNAS